ncbi:MAG TPA: tetraacyldisaccharide 4'-kinase [Saprospiraceae bacterium]|nr:tetraacyldisaccharide 4'-kinase [Saprospiraceae bacterium]
MIENKLAYILLYPFTLLYGLVINTRNFLFDSGMLKATKFSVPVISIGNLSIGGAGKTPHVEYMIQQLIPFLEVGILSRGYKRKTKGFMLVQTGHSALEAGDEPLMFKRKYSDVAVAVCESRTLAVPMIMKYYPDIQVILMDDGFQHRGILPGLNILLTPFGKPFTRDALLPSGRLREYPSAYSRADIIIITKCPVMADENMLLSLKNEINPLEHQQLFFTRYRYLPVYNFYLPKDKLSLHREMDIILISAIANTQYLLDYLEGMVASVHEMNFEDHHIFSERNIDYLHHIYKSRETSNKIILTTDKDAMRLDMWRNKMYDLGLPVYILPIEVEFLTDEGVFLQSVKKFLLDFKV